MITYKWRECEVSITLYDNQFVAESFETEATTIIKAENLLDLIKNKKIRYENMVVAAAVEAAVKAEAAERAAAVKAAIKATVEAIEEAPAEEVPSPRKRFNNGYFSNDVISYYNDGVTEIITHNRSTQHGNYKNSKPKQKKCFNKKHKITKQQICWKILESYSDEE